MLSSKLALDLTMCYNIGMMEICSTAVKNLTNVRTSQGDVVGIRKWYVEYFANDVLLTEFFRYESDARKFCSQVGGYVDYDHYRVIAEIEGVSA